MDRAHAAGGAKAARLPGLDAQRGLAAVLVVLVHVELFAGGTLFSRAWLAVDFFFLLSGFVMARTFELRFPGLAPARFGLMRWKRFFPIMAIGTLLGLAVKVDPPYHAAILMSVVLGLMLIPVPGKVAFPFNDPAWSIFAELAANVVHASVLWRLGSAALLGVAALSSLAQHWVGGNDLAGSVGLTRVFVGYPIGIILARNEARLPRLPWWLGMVALPVSCMAMAYAPDSLDILFPWLIAPVILLSGLSDFPAAAKPLELLGALSFPLYAVHMPVIMAIAMAGGSGPAMLTGALIAAAMVTAGQALLSRRATAASLAG